MIAISLLIFLGLYLGCLGLALWKPSGWWKLFWVALVLAPFFYYAWDIPLGYYTFIKTCDEKSGLKIYVNNPAQAKILRLGNGFSHSYASGFLEERPSLEKVEAPDKDFYYSRPTAYALYARGPEGKIIMIERDKVARGPNGTFFVEQRPSHADYVLMHTREYNTSLRITDDRYELKTADGLLVGSFSSIDFQWTLPSIHTSRCAYDPSGYRVLIDLIAKPSVASGGSKK